MFGFLKKLFKKKQRMKYFPKGPKIFMEESKVEKIIREMQTKKVYSK